MKTYENMKFDEERALYASDGVVLKNCAFDGPADGESALKESRNVEVYNTFCNLRYPFWHIDNLKIDSCDMTELCRAALWYSDHIEIRATKLHGIKALRECSDVRLSGCDIVSPEFGWSVNKIEMENCTAQSEYFMLRSENLRFRNVDFTGKYSFQYIKDAVFEDCRFDTKDAFWHAKNVTVKNSIVKGEYLAWYSENLTLINCEITGTQLFCYCKGLKLVNCRMADADLCFEKSDVNAEVTTPVISIKNPYSGKISVPSVEEIILDDPNAKAVVEISGKQCAGVCASGGAAPVHSR